jgi:hypothetical protein
VLLELQMTRWSRVHFIRQIQFRLRSKWARSTAVLAIHSLITGTIAKVASLVAIVIGGYGFAHGEPGAKKALAGVAAGTGIAVLAVNVLSWLWGV